MKRCSVSVAMRKMQIKSTTALHAPRDGLLHCWWKCKMAKPLRQTLGSLSEGQTWSYNWTPRRRPLRSMGRVCPSPHLLRCLIADDLFLAHFHSCVTLARLEILSRSMFRELSPLWKTEISCLVMTIVDGLQPSGFSRFPCHLPHRLHKDNSDCSQNKFALPAGGPQALATTRQDWGLLPTITLPSFSLWLFHIFPALPRWPATCISFSVNCAGKT